MSSESSDSGLLCLFTDQIDGFGAQYFECLRGFHALCPAKQAYRKCLQANPLSPRGCPPWGIFDFDLALGAAWLRSGALARLDLARLSPCGSRAGRTNSRDDGQQVVVGMRAPSMGIGARGLRLLRQVVSPSANMSRQGCNSERYSWPIPACSNARER